MKITDNERCGGMYKKLKNILGVSLMILAVVITQLPMTDIQAETSDTKQTANTVSFNMNGGNYYGTYNGYEFKGQSPVLVLDTNDIIDEYPDEKYAVNKGYQTEKEVWYTEKECLNEYDKTQKVTESITLYKKWFNITSDGTNESDTGFYLNPDKTVLYKYDGNDTHVIIPETVEIIAQNAFYDFKDIRGITLSANIKEIESNAFSGAKDYEGIVYIYDAENSKSQELANKLDDDYEQLVHSTYLNADAVEEIAGVEYENSDDKKESIEEESSSVVETSEATESTVETNDKEYTVEFIIGIDGIEGEVRSALADCTISDVVSVNGEQPKRLVPNEYTIFKDDGKNEITYKFQGWYKDLEYTQEWDFANDIVTSDMKIYAKWNKDERSYYFVTFIADGAGNVPDKIKLFEDETLSEPSKIPTIENKTFNGWYTDLSDTSTKYTKWGKTISTDLTLYAQWSQKVYTVTFNMNGGVFKGNYNSNSYTDVTTLTNSVVVGQGLSDSAYPENDTAATIKYSGYNTDSNWYTDIECLNAYSKNDSSGKPTVLTKNLTLYKKWYKTTSGFTMNPSGTVLYKYNGNDDDIVIPNTVTIIGANAFSSVNGVETITLPSNISDVKVNAFSGVNDISKDIKLLVASKSDKAVTMAKKLASDYTHLVYDDTTNSDTSKTSTGNSSDVSIVSSGNIKLGANNNATNSSKTTDTTASAKSNIVLGASGIGTANTNTTTNQSTDSVTVVDAGSINTGVSKTSDISATSSKTDNSTNTINNVQEKPAASVATETTSVTQRNNASNSKPKTQKATSNVVSNNQHIKDATPKTGDSMQYRMLIAYSLFSIGVLIILTGNGKKRTVASS